MTFIGPPHFGQRQRPGESSGEEACCSACGSCAEPSNWKQSGRRVARLRLARKPKLRMRTKPMGVAAQILQHIFGAAEGTFQVDDPVLPVEWP